MRNIAVFNLCVLCVSSAAFAPQTFFKSPKNLFGKYPSEKLFAGRPHPPLLTDSDAHLFRTRLREGVAKGVQFAGHYEVATWGCGSGCLSFAIIEARTGTVTFFPATISQVQEMGEPLTYKRLSKAIHVIGSLDEKNSADRWYIWDGKAFVLISEKPASLANENGDPTTP